MEHSAIAWQRSVYLEGFAGRKKSVSPDFASLEKLACRKLSRQAFHYVAGGAGGEVTMKRNVEDLDRYFIVPRVLRGIEGCDPSVKLFGRTLPSPLLLAPVGVLELAYPQADIAVAKAAAALRLPFIFSNQASFPMEDCAAVMGDSPRFFQLYWSKSRKLVHSFVSRAEQCGCSAIVVTLDTTMLGWRRRDIELGYLPFLEGKGIAQYTSDPVFKEIMNESETAPPSKAKVTPSSLLGLMKMVHRYPGRGFFRKLLSGEPRKAVQKFISTYSNPALNWEYVSHLRSITKLPIILKGILHVDDARRAIDHGADGVIVSNHGGRQVDGAISSIGALPSVISACEGKIPVLFDSGIRGGAHAFKAIALGATAVCVGRPYVYALALAGEQGVYDLMRHFMAEFELTMALSGCRMFRRLNPKWLARNNNFSRCSLRQHLPVHW